MIYRYGFGRYRDIKILYFFVSLFAVGIVASLYFKYIELLIFFTIGLFALLKILTAHETYLIMKGEV